MIAALVEERLGCPLTWDALGKKMIPRFHREWNKTAKTLLHLPPLKGDVVLMKLGQAWRKGEMPLVLFLVLVIDLEETRSTRLD